MGGILIGTGIYGFVKMENYFLIMGDEYLFTSSILTGIGATILVIGFKLPGCHSYRANILWAWTKRKVSKA